MESDVITSAKTFLEEAIKRETQAYMTAKYGDTKDREYHLKCLQEVTLARENLSYLEDRAKQLERIEA